MKKLEFGLGHGFYDVHPDKPPYHLDSHHIKLSIKGHIVVSFALAIEVPKTSQVPYPCE